MITQYESLERFEVVDPPIVSEFNSTLRSIWFEATTIDQLEEFYDVYVVGTLDYYNSTYIE